MLYTHKQVTYDPTKMSSLKYRVGLLQSMAYLNSIKIKAYKHKSLQYPNVLSLATLVSNADTASQVQQELKPWIESIDKVKIQNVTIGSKENPVKSQIAIWASYSYFMTHIALQIDSMFARHLSVPFDDDMNQPIKVNDPLPYVITETKTKVINLIMDNAPGANKPEARPDQVKFKCNAVVPIEVCSNVNEGNGLEALSSQKDITSSSIDHNVKFEAGNAEHRGVIYEKAKLTSLGYRIEVIKSIADRNKMPIKQKYGPRYINAIEIMWIIGDYETRNIAYKSFSQLQNVVRVFYSYEDPQSIPDSYESFKTKYGNGYQYWCTYDLFWLHVLPHIRSDFADHLRQSAVVNDLVLNQAIKNNDLTGFNEARANNKLQPLSISALQPSVSFENGDAEHKSVRYHKGKLTSLGYRIEIIKAIVVKKQFKLRSLTGHVQTILIIDLLKIVGDYKNDNAVKSALENLKVQKLYNDCKRGVDGLVVTKYNSGDRYWCSYDYFMRNLVPHINSDFAKHLLDASFVNDLVVSSGTKRAETLIEHNRAINAQCSTSQEQLENIVDQGLQSTGLKMIEPIIQPNVPVITCRGVYVAKTALDYNGYHIAKIGKSVKVYERGPQNGKEIPGFSIYHLEETKDEHDLEQRLHSTFKSNQVTMSINGKNQTELFTYQTEEDFQDFISAAATINNNLKKLEGPNMDYERELTKRMEIEAPIKIAEVQVKLEELKTEQLRMKLELAKIEKGIPV